VVKQKGFEKVMNQIGYCGIWCGSCVLGNGSLRELTQKYGEITNRYGLREWAPKDFNFEEFKKALSLVHEASSCPGCLRGGGRFACEMRACACSKNLPDCSECNSFLACENSEQLLKMRKGAREAGLLVKEKGDSRKKFVEDGIKELGKRFPSCILLCEKR
jgi:hypothetical protein